MKKALKIILIVILIIALIAGGLFVWQIFGSFKSNSAKYYEELADTSQLLPTADSLPEHISVEYKYFEDYMLIFTSKAYTMIVEYDKETYNTQKQIAHLPFENIDELTTYNGKEDEIITNTSPIELDGFSFKMYSEWYPKFIYFIGVNDETNQIAYIYFEDIDLDSISVPYSTFIDQYCGW